MVIARASWTPETPELLRGLGLNFDPAVADLAVTVEASDRRERDLIECDVLVVADEMDSELVRSLILGWLLQTAMSGTLSTLERWLLLPGVSLSDRGGLARVASEGGARDAWGRLIEPTLVGLCDESADGRLAVEMNGLGASV